MAIGQVILMKAVSKKTRALREIMTKSDLHTPLDRGIADRANWSTLRVKGLLKQLETSVAQSWPWPVPPQTFSLHRSVALE